MGNTEAELIRQAQAGDMTAFAELVEKYQAFVYNLAIRTLNHPQEAEDLTQEAFVRVWRALPHFRQQAKFQTWLYRIVTNLCYNRLPHLRRELTALGQEMLDDIPDETFTDPAHQVATKEQQMFLHQQIDQLPESYRLLISLRYHSGLSYNEIAEVLGVPLGTVKTGIFRARAQLRQALRYFEE